LSRIRSRTVKTWVRLRVRLRVRVRVGVGVGVRVRVRVKVRVRVSTVKTEYRLSTSVCSSSSRCAAPSAS